MSALAGVIALCCLVPIVVTSLVGAVIESGRIHRAGGQR